MRWNEHLIKYIFLLLQFFYSKSIKYLGFVSSDMKLTISYFQDTMLSIVFMQHKFPTPTKEKIELLSNR